MKRIPPQTYENHKSFDWLHIGATLSLPPALLVAIAALLPCMSMRASLTLLSLLVVYLLCLNAVLLIKVRLYPLVLQDRIIRLELELRLRRLLPEDEHWQINGLTMDQVVALHYAPDDELPALMRKTLDDPILERDKIKRLIKRWLPDYDRI